MKPVFNVLGAGRRIAVSKIPHDVPLRKGQIHPRKSLVHAPSQCTVQTAEDAAKRDQLLTS